MSSISENPSFAPSALNQPLTTASAPTELLRAEEIRVHFPVGRGGIFKRDRRTVKAVDGLSLSIAPGETLGLVGESGSGKSTMGRALLRLISLTSGSLFFEGTNIAALKGEGLKQFRSKAQMVFQNPYSSLNPRMTVGTIIEEPLRALTPMTKSQRAQRVKELLDEVHLSPKFLNRYPHEFSGGQRQRINIARALAVSPRLVIADEPVSALDVSIQAQIINLLLELQERYHMAMIFIAHDLSVVKALSHRVAVMYLGRIVEIGAADSVFSNPKHPYTQALLSAVPEPDPQIERHKKTLVLQGDIPSPIHPPSGCPFHTRCPRAIAACRSIVPSLRVYQEDRRVACDLVE